MAVPMHLRADRAILKRQQQESAHESLVAGHVERFKVEQKSQWENRMDGVIRSNKVKSKAAALEAQHRASLQARRQKLAAKLNAEQRAFEQEMVDREETPQQRMEKLAARAYDLKKRREDERKAIVQEKLYQQWRAGIDDLRTMDAKIVELRCIAERDYQLDEKAAVVAEEKAHDEFYDRLWHEGYLAKIEREEREKELKHDRGEQQKATLAIQLQMKDEKARNERELEIAEADELKQQWKEHAEQEKQAVIRSRALAKAERKKADEYMVIAQQARAEEERLEKDFDKNFVAGVLERERKLAEKELAEKASAKKKAVEFTEALKREMARNAESEETLIRLQHEESERQWQKRYVQWEKEEIARRNLMEEVYGDRAEQVRMKQDLRDQVKGELAREREAAENEVRRLAAMEKERLEMEAIIRKHHQEELFRQMDFRQEQVQHEQEQQIEEQRRRDQAEEKIRLAVEAEKQKAQAIMRSVAEKRAAKIASSGPVAPWDR